MLKPTRSKRDRAKDPRRVVKSVHTHDETMNALGRAAGWKRKNNETVAIKDNWSGPQHRIFVPGSTGIETWSQPSRLYKSAKEINNGN